MFCEFLLILKLVKSHGCVFLSPLVGLKFLKKSNSSHAISKYEKYDFRNSMFTMLTTLKRFKIFSATNKNNEEKNCFTR